MLLIGLGHKAQHGKDTFAAAVQAAFGQILNIRLMSFADPLREEVRNAARELWESLYPQRPFDPQAALRELCESRNLTFEENAPVDIDYPWGKQRVLHQWWGTEYRRAEDPLYWVKRAQERIAKARAEGVHALLFRDMRFHNEYDMIGAEGGWRIKVSRLGYVTDVPQHISETELDDRPFDLHLGVKDGNLPLLQAQSVGMFVSLLATVRPDLQLRFIR